jgi:PI-3-kinase-related kinase SMG-1
MPGLEVHTAMVSSEMPKISVDLGVPGSRSGLPGIVTVAAFGAHVTILATKTKPKKLQMVGSDGCHYPYLLKGREDLRLDARIMQLLQAVNGMLRACSATRRRGLAVRHYSVTPISGCAGLIRWVDNLTSMYSVYKAWQQRTQAAQLATAPGNAQFPLPSIPRPSDLFYGKIIPALKEKGLRRVISRRDWPQEVKRKVLIELMKETPRQLLHRELWCASEGVSALRLKMEQ